MPLPLGHLAVGLAANELISDQNDYDRENRTPSASRKWFALAWVTFLANLPDIDVFFGLFLKGDAWAYHRGPTHSLLFSLVAAYPMTHAHRLWSRIPRITYKTAFFLILTHVFADILFTGSPASLFWPLETAKLSNSATGWVETGSLVLRSAIIDGKVILGSLSLVALIRFMKTWRAGFNMPLPVAVRPGISSKK